MNLKRAEITVKAYAKINLFLDITGRRDDGYHNLDTVMQKIELCDELKIKIYEGDTKIHISCDDPVIPTDERNIAYKAARAYLAAAGLSAEIDIAIKKSIPVMAGLGGSSADGSAVLKALNEHYKSLKNAELLKIAAKLGADLPFCLFKTTAHCKGIGEIMTDCEPLKDCSLLIVKPDFSYNTALGFDIYDKSPISSKGEPDMLLNALNKNNLNDIGKSLYNIFEPLYLNPEIEKIKYELIRYGAYGALMSGSGSAVYGIFSDLNNAEKAGEKMNYPVKITTKPFSRLKKI